MRKVFLALCCVVLAIPSFAAGPRTRHPQPASDPVHLDFTPLENGSEIAAKLIGQLRAQGPSASAIAYNGGVRAFVIPAAGNLQGNKGTFYKSDLTLSNLNSTDQRVMVIWYPAGGGTPTVGIVTFPSDRLAFTVQDFVGQVLKLSGLGSLIFIPVDAANNVDPNGAIDGTSRIWTPQPNAAGTAFAGGTVSQTFAGADLSTMKGEYEGQILGLRQDGQFRTNYGIVNLSNRALPFVVTVFPDTWPGGPLPEVAVTVPAQSMVQTNIPAGNFGLLTLLVSVDQDQPDSDFTWIAYASSTDNTTGDGWVALVGNENDDDLLDGLRTGTARKK